MDLQQLGKDIITVNRPSLLLRIQKLNAVLKRRLLLPFRNNFNKNKKFKSIPIIINNRNRFTYLLKLIDWLEKNGYTNISIIDNDSSYPPLLDYYSKTSYHVFRLKENVGHLSLWKTGIIHQFEKDYYVYTDPDILPVEECPGDMVSFFMKKLDTYSFIEKIGFGLKTDDLPGHYSDKQKVMDWENKFWTREVEPGVFDAAIDTTFALYRPYTNGAKWVQKAYRTGGKYMARHLPWYENSSVPTEEELFYKKTVKPGASHWIEAPEATQEFRHE